MSRIKCNKKGCNKMATIEHEPCFYCYDFECDFLKQVAYCKKH